MLIYIIIKDLNNIIMITLKFIDQVKVNRFYIALYKRKCKR